MQPVKTKETKTELKELFNRSLDNRVQNPLKPLEEEADSFNKSLSLEEVINNTIDIILQDNSYYDTTDLNRHLNRVFELQKELFDSLDIDDGIKQRRFISKSGNIISPQHCIHTIKDSLRVRVYLRGIHFALEELMDKYPQDETINILYPACGPFAPLLLPLILKYKNDNKYQKRLKVTLIDMQKGATLTLQALIQRLNIEEYIEDIYEMDALDYYPKENQKIHMVVLEAINHGFTKEGHLLLTKHFSKFLDKDGLFIPQKVTIKAFLNKPNDEYVEQWKDSFECREIARKDEILNQRTEIGEVLTLTQNNIQNLKEVPSNDPEIKLVECATLKIPIPVGEFSKQYLLFTAYLNIYKDENLGEYDSGISHPYPMYNFCLNYTPNDIQEDDLLVKSGDVVTFYYRLDGLPSFIPFKKKEFNR